MKSIHLSGTRNLMNQLLTNETFDRFCLVSALIRMSVTYEFDGHINPEFYEEDQIPPSPYCEWGFIKPSVVTAVRGKNLPLSMKFVLAVPSSSIPFFVSKSGTTIKAEDVEGMYLNILYSKKQPNDVTVTTGISCRTFTMDKSLEQYYDRYMLTFLRQKVDPDASDEL